MHFAENDFRAKPVDKGQDGFDGRSPIAVDTGIEGTKLGTGNDQGTLEDDPGEQIWMVQGGPKNDHSSHRVSNNVQWYFGEHQLDALKRD